MATYSAVVSLKAIFSSFLHYYDAALPPENLYIYEFVHKELKLFQDFLDRLDSKSRKRMDASLQRVKEELHIFGGNMYRRGYGSFDKLVEEIHSLIEKLKKVEEEYYNYNEEAFSSSSSSKMVGLCSERSELKEALLDRLVEPTFFLLHGMAGIGKTTLAWELFEDLDISEWFECRVWVKVGRERKPEELIEVILAQLDPEAYKMVMGEDEDEIVQQFYKILIAKRCLIVLDDVWDNQDFEEYWYRFLAAVYNKNGSRVVVTTRINHLGNSRMARAWYVFEKRFLNKEESWDLLREKAFAGGSCPPQLEDAGKKIAEKCDGLPLTIVTITDLLSEGEESLWVDVAGQKKHKLFIDAYDRISQVLYPSYKELHDELKLCFLYMGVFPLKYEISRSKLINLWTAEEFFYANVKQNEIYYHDLESLKFLDFCNLIMVHRRGSTYFQEIRTCGLHSSWWHFCQREATKTTLFHVLDCPEDSSEECIKGQSRLSIHNNVLLACNDVYNSVEKNCASTAQSLLCFGLYHQYQVPICFGLKLLQRLDALNIRFYDFPLEVVELVKLRYLALTCNEELPPSISKLGRLQYLIVHPHLSIKSHGAPSYMPMEIWDLEELKHLQVMGCNLPDFGDNSLGMLSTLLDVSTHSCIVLNRLPNLKKLKIRVELTPDVVDPLCFINDISNLFNLISFKCIVVNPGCMYQVVPPIASLPVLPSSLNKLSLSGLDYPWEEMKEVALLPSLQQLKLRCSAFQGPNWKIVEGGFPSLCFLLIEDIDLVKLEGAPGSFKSLKHLSIKYCHDLEEIQLENLYDVSEIEVFDSNPLAEKSIKKRMIEKMVVTGPNILVHYSWKSAIKTSIRRSEFRGCRNCE